MTSSLVRLADVCEIRSDLVDPTESHYASCRHIGGANIEAGSGRLIDIRTAGEEGLKSGKFPFDERMVLYSKIRPYLRKVARPPFAGLCSADIYPLLPVEGRLDRGYLYYLLMARRFTEYAIAGSARAGMPKVNREHLFAFQFMLPSRAEQQRVVRVLDEASAAISLVQGNTSTNLASATEILDSAREEVLAVGETGPSPAKPLDELCELIADCEHRTAPTQPEGIPSIRTPNIGRGRLLLRDVNRVSEETYREWTRRAEPRGGDLILAREAPAGNVAVVPPGLRVCLGQRTVLIRPRPSVLEPGYLAHLLLRRDSQRRLLAHSRGATVQHINVKDIREFKLDGLPSLAVQRAAVERLEALQDRQDALLSVQREKLRSLDELSEALLDEAFASPANA